MINKKEIQEISRKINMPEEKVEKMLKETFDTITKPPLDNIDCPQHYEIGVGSSDKV